MRSAARTFCQNVAAQLLGCVCVSVRGEAIISALVFLSLACRRDDCAQRSRFDSLGLIKDCAWLTSRARSPSPAEGN